MVAVVDEKFEQKKFGGREAVWKAVGLMRADEGRNSGCVTRNGEEGTEFRLSICCW